MLAFCHGLGPVLSLLLWLQPLPCFPSMLYLEHNCIWVSLQKCFSRHAVVASAAVLSEALVRWAWSPPPCTCCPCAPHAVLTSIPSHRQARALLGQQKHHERTSVDGKAPQELLSDHHSVRLHLVTGLPSVVAQRAPVHLSVYAANEFGLTVRGAHAAVPLSCAVIVPGADAGAGSYPLRTGEDGGEWGDWGSVGL